MKRRGMTLVELLVLIFLVLAIAGGVAGLVDKECRGCLTPIVAILSFAFLIALKHFWDAKVALPRLLRRLDRLNATEGEIAPDIRRLTGLWVSAGALEKTLLPRIDLEGPCRSAYLEILAEHAGRRDVAERLRHLAEEPDPLAPRAREILAWHDRRSRST